MQSNYLLPCDGEKFLTHDSYLDQHYSSDIMKSLVSLVSPQNEISFHRQQAYNKPLVYRPKDILPDWLLINEDWKALRGQKLANEVSDILKIRVNDRSSQQSMILIEWIMSVWPVAASMGIKRVASMMKEFVYSKFDPGENIVSEGDHGQSFFVIISGDVEVHKKGVGVVGKLSKGATFGEIALTNQSADSDGDLRTATIRVSGVFPAEVLSLHKVDYDHFVRDIQLLERRENFLILKESRLLQFWPRTKIEKLSNTALRRIYSDGEVVCHQGDPSNHIFFILEGEVRIVKQVSIVATNKWPRGANAWEEMKKQFRKPILLNVLSRGEYFGEVAVIRNCPRTATAVVSAPRTVLILLDRIEYLRTFIIVSRHQPVTNIEDEVKKYKADSYVVQHVNKVKGGPHSYVKSGDTIYYPNSAENLSHVDHPEPIEDKEQPQLRRLTVAKEKELQNGLEIATHTLTTMSSKMNKTLSTIFPSLEEDHRNMANKSRKASRKISSSHAKDSANKISSASNNSNTEESDFNFPALGNH